MQCEIVNRQCEMVNMLCEMVNRLCEMVNMLCEMVNMQYEMVNILCEMVNMTCDMVNIPCGSSPLRSQNSKSTKYVWSINVNFTTSFLDKMLKIRCEKKFRGDKCAFAPYPCIRPCILCSLLLSMAFRKHKTNCSAL